MKITSVSVEELFYAYTYSINLKTDDRVSIIHAPNGYGKTTIFRLIRDVFDLNVKGLYSIPFKCFSIYLSDQTIIEITKNEQMDTGEYPYNLIFEIINLENEKKIRSSLQEVARHLGDSHVQYYLLERSFNQFINENHELISEIKRIRENMEVHFVETSRLYVQPDENRSYSIIEYEKGKTASRNEFGRKNLRAAIEANERIVYCANHLKSIINKVKQQYSIVSEEIDRSFPNRLVNAVNDKSKPYTYDEIKNKLEELEAKRKELKRTGFISSDQNEALQSTTTSNETLMLFYSLYVDDTFKKLSHYDDIKRKIELFLEIINNRTSFSNKEMCLNSEGSVVFKPTVETNILNREIALGSLSSGEKHNFILFYELIFNSDKKSVFLIDEPEISLHVAWQVEYINIIEEICNMNNMQAIIATHSPDIVNNRDDLLISLGLEEKDNDYE